MSEAPERIWAGPDVRLGWDFPSAELKPWEEMGRVTEYVRADTIERLQEELREAREAMQTAHDLLCAGKPNTAIEQLAFGLAAPGRAFLAKVQP